jgi:hypothetical protein
MSCERCMNIVFKPWDQLNPIEAERVSSPQFNQRSSDSLDAYAGVLTLVYVHQENMAKLRLSSQQCHFCHKLYVGFQKVLGGMCTDRDYKDLVEPSLNSAISLSIVIRPQYGDDLGCLDNVHIVSAHWEFFDVESSVRMRSRGMYSISASNGSHALYFRSIYLGSVLHARYDSTPT